MSGQPSQQPADQGPASKETSITAAQPASLGSLPQQSLSLLSDFDLALSTGSINSSLVVEGVKQHLATLDNDQAKNEVLVAICTQLRDKVEGESVLVHDLLELCQEGNFWKATHASFAKWKAGIQGLGTMAAWGSQSRNRRNELAKLIIEWCEPGCPRAEACVALDRQPYPHSRSFFEQLLALLKDGHSYAAICTFGNAAAIARITRQGGRVGVSRQNCTETGDLKLLEDVRYTPLSPEMLHSARVAQHADGFLIPCDSDLPERATIAASGATDGVARAIKAFRPGLLGDQPHALVTSGRLVSAPRKDAKGKQAKAVKSKGKGKADDTAAAAAKDTNSAADAAANSDSHSCKCGPVVPATLKDRIDGLSVNSKVPELESVASASEQHAVWASLCIFHCRAIYTRGLGRHDFATVLGGSRKASDVEPGLEPGLAVYRKLRQLIAHFAENAKAKLVFNAWKSMEQPDWAMIDAVEVDLTVPLAGASGARAAGGGERHDELHAGGGRDDEADVRSSTANSKQPGGKKRARKAAGPGVEGAEKPVKRAKSKPKPKKQPKSSA